MNSNANHHIHLIYRHCFYDMGLHNILNLGYRLILTLHKCSIFLVSKAALLITDNYLIVMA